ncbi:MAG: hypothetical protein WCF23_15200 [Candidatus Nitrosopolaris sp.]
MVKANDNLSVLSRLLLEIIVSGYLFVLVEEEFNHLTLLEERIGKRRYNPKCFQKGDWAAKVRFSINTRIVSSIAN